MRKVLSGFLVVFFAFASFASAFSPPAPTGHVNDFVGILSAGEKVSLENTLVDFEKQTSNEIVVVIVSSFEGLDSFSYSQELFTKWGIGKKDKNNGILFLIGPKEGLPFPERGDAFINVGGGLEGAVPDSVAGSILRNEVFPEFKAKNYASGIQKGLSALMLATKGEYTAEAKSSGTDNGGLISFGIWFAFMFLSYLASFLGRSKSWWLGGALGGAGGVIVGFIFWTGIAIAISAGVFGGLGLLFDFIVSKNYAYRKAHGKPTDFFHSGGGFWFGGGRGGFGGGGGFGGFGGGGSRGGGAGGGW